MWLYLLTLLMFFDSSTGLTVEIEKTPPSLQVRKLKDPFATGMYAIHPQTVLPNMFKSTPDPKSVDFTFYPKFPEVKPDGQQRFDDVYNVKDRADHYNIANPVFKIKDKWDGDTRAKQHTCVFLKVMSNGQELVAVFKDEKKNKMKSYTAAEFAKLIEGENGRNGRRVQKYFQRVGNALYPNRKGHIHRHINQYRKLKAADKAHTGLVNQYEYAGEEYGDDYYGDYGYDDSGYDDDVYDNDGEYDGDAFEIGYRSGYQAAMQRLMRNRNLW